MMWPGTRLNLSRGRGPVIGPANHCMQAEAQTVSSCIRNLCGLAGGDAGRSYI